MTRYPALAALILGAIAALGFAPLELWPLTLAAFATWMWLVHGAASLRAALWRGWLFGVGHFTIANNWIQHAFDFQDKMPPVLGYGAVVALALYLAVFPALAAGLAWRFGRAHTSARPMSEPNPTLSVRFERSRETLVGRYVSRLRSKRTEEGTAAGAAEVPTKLPTPIDTPYILTFAAAWIATEWLRAELFTGYAWDPLAVIWVPVQDLASTSALVGTYALSGLTVAMAGFMLIAARSGRTSAITTVAIVALVLMLDQSLSYAQLATPWAAPPAAPRLRIVQPGISQDARGEEDSEPMIRALIAQSGRPGPAPRLIVWPEGVIRDYVEDGYPWRYTFWQEPPADVRRRFASILGPRDILLFGGNALQFDQGGKHQTATNSVFALGPGGRLLGRYDKAHLVPYGEYLPMRWLLEPLGLSRLVPGDLDFRDGPGPRGLVLPGFGPIAMQICYEIIFSGEVVHDHQRPRLMFNPSNDAWFGKWGPPQFFAQARLRAIEEGVAVVRATPTGISGAIGPDGRILALVPPGPAGSVELSLPASTAPTPFSRIGNWAALSVALLLAVSAVALRRHQR